MQETLTGRERGAAVRIDFWPVAVGIHGRGAAADIVKLAAVSGWSGRPFVCGYLAERDGLRDRCFRQRFLFWGEMVVEVKMPCFK